MNNPPPLNFLQLKFSSIEQFESYWSNYPGIFRMIWLWHENLGDHDGAIEWPGICNVCMSNTIFTVNPVRTEMQGFTFRSRWADLICRQCRLSACDRHLITHLREIGDENIQIYHVGSHSKLAKYIRNKYNNTVCGQYKEGRPSGFIDDGGTRYEDLNGCSFENSSVDAVVCSEVLEHIPDYTKAINEIHRILKVDGHAILTFPWLGGKNYDHQVRAELQPDGTIKHHLPPQYHGDPAQTDGILSFRSFGWKILDELRDCGFKKAYTLHKFGPVHGFMSLIEPVIVAIK